MANPKCYNCYIRGIERSEFDAWVGEIEAAKATAPAYSELLVFTPEARIEIYDFDGQEWTLREALSRNNEVAAMIVRFPELEDRTFIIRQRELA